MFCPVSPGVCNCRPGHTVRKRLMNPSSCVNFNACKQSTGYVNNKRHKSFENVPTSTPRVNCCQPPENCSHPIPLSHCLSRWAGRVPLARGSALRFTGSSVSCGRQHTQGHDSGLLVVSLPGRLWGHGERDIHCNVDTEKRIKNKLARARTYVSQLRSAKQN